MRKRGYLLVLAMASMLALTACNREAEDTKDSTTNTEEGAETQTPVSLPEITNSKLTKLGEYKGMEVTLTPDEVTDDMVEAQVATAVSEAAPSKEVVEDGDTVVIDFKGLLDGEAFDGGTATDYELVIGSNSFIDGFEEGLIGKKVDDFVELPLTFPEDYREEGQSGSELNGADVIFEVTIKYIYPKETPELTDEFAKNYLEAESADAFRASVRADLEAQALEAMNSDSNKQLAVAEALIAASEFDCDETEVAAYADQARSTYEGYASAYGMELSDFLTMLMGMTEEEFDAQCTENGTFQVQLHLLVEAIAEKEGMQLTDEEYTTGATELATNNGYSSLEEFESLFAKEMIASDLLQRKIVSFLVENAVFNQQ